MQFDLICSFFGFAMFMSMFFFGGGVPYSTFFSRLNLHMMIIHQLYAMIEEQASQTLLKG